MTNSNKHRKFRFSSETASAIPELAITLPLIVLLLFGILAFGRLISQMSRANNAAFSTARAGLDQDGAIGYSSMVLRKENFDYQFNNYTNSFNLHSEYRLEQSIPVVEAKIQGDLSPLQNKFKSLLFSSSIVALHVALGQSVLSDFVNFDLLDGQRYNCDGEPCSFGNYSFCPNAPCGTVLKAPADSLVSPTG